MEESAEVFSQLHRELERLAGELAECKEERACSGQRWAREVREEREREREREPQPWWVSLSQEYLQQAL